MICEWGGQHNWSLSGLYRRVSVKCLSEGNCSSQAGKEPETLRECWWRQCWGTVWLVLFFRARSMRPGKPCQPVLSSTVLSYMTLRFWAESENMSFCPIIRDSGWFGNSKGSQSCLRLTAVCCVMSTAKRQRHKFAWQWEQNQCYPVFQTCTVQCHQRTYDVELNGGQAHQRGFVYKINRMGPSTDHWGTP